MAFEIVKTFVIKAPPAAVWSFLTDPTSVARCLPGAAVTGKLDEKTWQGTMTVKVGPVSSSYKGKIVFERLDAATMTAEIAAVGQDVRGRGGADLKLTSSVRQNAAGETEVTATSLVNITGILAQMGRGMIQDVSDQMFQIFSQRMRAELEAAQAAAAPAPVAAAPAAVAADATMAAPAAAIVAAPAAPAPLPPKPEALDVGAIGARAAGNAALRAVRGPGLWIACAAAATLIYLLFRCS